MLIAKGLLQAVARRDTLAVAAGSYGPETLMDDQPILRYEVVEVGKPLGPVRCASCPPPDHAGLHT